LPVIATKPNRDGLKDDFKIIAQACCKDDALLITADKRTMKRFADRLHSSNIINLQTIDISEGYNDDLLSPKKTGQFHNDQETFNFNSGQE
jgi:hypothetical protein